MTTVDLALGVVLVLGALVIGGLLGVAGEMSQQKPQAIPCPICGRSTADTNPDVELVAEWSESALFRDGKLVGPAFSGRGRMICQRPECAEAAKRRNATLLAQWMKQHKDDKPAEGATVMQIADDGGAWERMHARVQEQVIP